MRRRFSRLFLVLLSAFAATTLASCVEGTGTDPRFANLIGVSGSGQATGVGSNLPQPFVVRVEDQFGQAVEGATVRWQVISGGGSISPSQSVSDATGDASATLRVGTTIGPNSVRASVGPAQVVFTATATSAPPANLLIVSGNGQSGVVATQLLGDLTVKVTDAVGGAKSGVVVNLAVLSGGGSLNAGSATTDATGLASVKWTLGTGAGGQSVLASVTGITPVTFTATGIAGAPDLLSIESGNNQSGPPGTPLPDSLRVRLTDRFGNPIGGMLILWTPSPGSGTVNPASGPTDGNGRTATRWTLGSTGGPKTVVAGGGGFSKTFTGGGNVTYQTMSAGSRHSCGLAQGGVAYCWGYNGDGQLGLGAAAQGSGPVFSFPQPSGTTGNLTFSLLRSGRFHSCALTLAGVGYCWGNNIDGRVGGGSAGVVISPTALATTNTFGQVSPGSVHSCGVDLAGRGYCWGANLDGEIGDATNVNRSVPTAVSGGILFSAISAGGLHSCAIAMTTIGWCWGNNASGQLGNSSTVASNVPVAVSGGLSFSAISAGFLHTCALDGAGVAYCWGNNSSGQLGTGGGPSSAPAVVSGGLVFSAISAGQFHTCAVTAAGALYCWGSNAKGQLGDGTTTNRSAPTLVSSVLVFRSIGAGDGHTCAVTSANLSYCWGDNEFGQLGDGTTTNRFVPTKVSFQP